MQEPADQIVACVLAPVHSGDTPVTEDGGDLVRALSSRIQECIVDPAGMVKGRAYSREGIYEGAATALLRIYAAATTPFLTPEQLPSEAARAAQPPARTWASTPPAIERALALLDDAFVDEYVYHLWLLPDDMEYRLASDDPDAAYGWARAAMAPRKASVFVRDNAADHHAQAGHCPADLEDGIDLVTEYYRAARVFCSLAEPLICWALGEDSVCPDEIAADLPMTMRAGYLVAQLGSSLRL